MKVHGQVSRPSLPLPPSSPTKLLDLTLKRDQIKQAVSSFLFSFCFKISIMHNSNLYTFLVSVRSWQFSERAVPGFHLFTEICSGFLSLSDYNLSPMSSSSFLPHSLWTEAMISNPGMKEIWKAKCLSSISQIFTRKGHEFWKTKVLETCKIVREVGEFVLVEEKTWNFESTRGRFEVEGGMKKLLLK